MLIRHWLAAASLLAACSSFAAPPEVQGSGQAPGASVVSPAAAASPRPLIAKLVMRDAELAIVSSPEGPRFSVANREGAVLSSELGEAELKAQYPAIYQLYRSAMVHTGAPYLDATLTRPLVDRDRP
jgi:hypothetical protein